MRRNQQNKKKIKRRKKGFRLWHFLILLIIFYLGKTLINQSMMMNELAKRKQKEEQEIQKLQEDIKELEAEIENKDTLEFVEKVAREELRLVKPREIIYIDKNKGNNSLINSAK